MPKYALPVLEPGPSPKVRSIIIEKKYSSDEMDPLKSSNVLSF